MSAAASSSANLLRPTMTTCAPSWAKSFAEARPIPLPPPVMTAILPVSFAISITPWRRCDRARRTGAVGLVPRGMGIPWSADLSGLVGVDDLAEDVALAEMFEGGLDFVICEAAVNHRADAMARDGRDSVLQVLAILGRNRLGPSKSAKHVEVA